MHMLTMAAVVALSLFFQSASEAVGSEIELPSDFSQSQLEDLGRQFGTAISYTPLAPAEPLGILGFDVGLEVTMVDIDQDEDFWADTDDDLPNYLLFPKIHVQKGLPLGFDVGLLYAKSPGTNIGLLGGELKWAFVKGGIAFPAIALRGSYTQLVGVDDLDLATYGIDLSISKGFAFLTPYAGIGQIWIQAEEKADIGLDEEDLNLTKGFIGLKLTLLLFSFVVEADFAEVPLYSLRANLSF